MNHRALTLLTFPLDLPEDAVPLLKMLLGRDHPVVTHLVEGRQPFRDSLRFLGRQTLHPRAGEAGGERSDARSDLRQRTCHGKDNHGKRLALVGSSREAAQFLAHDR